MAQNTYPSSPPPHHHYPHHPHIRLGGESLCVAQNTYAVGWFQGSALNTVFGLQLSFSRMGSTVNMNVMQPLYKSLQGTMHGSPGYRVLGVALGIG